MRYCHVLSSLFYTVLTASVAQRGRRRRGGGTRCGDVSWDNAAREGGTRSRMWRIGVGRYPQVRYICNFTVAMFWKGRLPRKQHGGPTFLFRMWASKATQGLAASAPASHRVGPVNGHTGLPVLFADLTVLLTRLSSQLTMYCSVSNPPQVKTQ